MLLILPRKEAWLVHTWSCKCTSKYPSTITATQAKRLPKVLQGASSSRLITRHTVLQCVCCTGLLALAQTLGEVHGGFGTVL